MFFIDSNLPYSAKQAFLQYGKALHTRDVGLKDAPDIVVHAYAVSQNAILVTQDLEFSNLTLFSYPRGTGLIILRIPSFYRKQYIEKFIDTFLSEHGRNDFTNAVTVVQPGWIRRRPIE